MTNAERQRKYAAAHPEKMAVPSWGNKFFIGEIYRLAAKRGALTGIQWHVDHVIPLQHPLVCGLHVEGNLRVVQATVNWKKNNRFAIGEVDG